MKALLGLRSYLKPYWGLILLSSLLAIPMAALRTSPVVLVKQLIDELLVSKDTGKLLTVPLMVIGIYLANFVVRFIHYYALRIVVARVDQKLKNDLYDHVMGLSADYFTTQSAGGLVSRVGADPLYVGQGVWQINSMIREPVQLLLCIGYAIYVDWRLTLITIGIFPFVLIIGRVTGKAVKRYIQKQQIEQEKMFGTLQESFTGFRIIKAFGLEPYTRRKFNDRSEGFARYVLKTAMFEEASHPLVELVTAFAVAGIVYYGGSRVLNGHLTQGEFMSFFTAFALMMNPIRQLNEINLKLNSSDGAWARVQELFSWQTHLKEAVDAKPVDHFQSALEFKDVHFAYPDEPSREILKGINFKLAKGKSIALVGASGAGKSSLATLVPRIFDVTQGAITLDGRDVRDLKVKDLRDLVSVVSQDVFLFNDTILENIRCGKLDATDQEIIEAAQRAHAMDFIRRLPDGLKTVIGDRGQKLSGGERQRISIARAFLRQSPILVLDEATSALDSASERIVQEALERLMQDRTVIMIAHRLSTIRRADEIVVMEQGKVIERGTHAELVQSDGAYSRFLKIGETRESHA